MYNYLGTRGNESIDLSMTVAKIVAYNNVNWFEISEPVV